MTQSQVARVHGGAAVLLAVGLLFVGAAAADRYRLPLIHGWALAHGAIFIVFPVYFLVSYFALLPIVRRVKVIPATAVSGRLSFLAVASLLLSGSGFLIPLVGSVLGIALGHLARSRCKANPALSGSGVALAGLVLGYLGLAYSLYGIGILWWASHRGS